MDSNATTVLLLGFGPHCNVNLFITGGLGTTTVEPGGGDSTRIGLAIGLSM